MSDVSRRTFNKRVLSTAVAAGVATGLHRETARAEQATDGDTGGSAARRPVRLGGPVFGKIDDPEQLALAHKNLGYRAAYCPHVGLDDTARIEAIRKAFARHDVVIAEVGRWVNLLDADADKRKENLRIVTEGLALAEAIDARCCVDIAGSFSTDQWYGPHPDNLSRRHFDATVENTRKIVDAVKPERAKFCLEMIGWAHPSSADEYLALIKAVDRKGFGVHIDVCNAINCPERFYRNTELTHELFDKLGPHVVSCHAKDLVWDVEMNIHFREVPCGAGKVDLGTYLRRISMLGHEAPLMIEHCKDEAEYTKAREYLQQLAPKVGVSLG